MMMQAANDNSAPANAGALRFLSVCSGIEAASVAWPQWQAVAFAEIEKFPSAVLAHHYPEVTNLGDFTKINTTTLGRVDIFCGGTPCQAFSVAGLRQSLDDARGNLSLEFVRLAHELAGNGTTDGNGLRNVVWENVPGVLSTKDNAFGCFLAGLVGATDALPPPKGRLWPNAGMVAGPKGRAAWRVLDAQFFGLAQRRKRVIVVADFGNGADPAAVLFEPEGVRRDSPPSRETGEGVAAAVAPSLTASGRGVERTGDTRGQDPVVAVLRGHSDYCDGLPSIRAKGGDCAGGSEALVAYAPEIARCDATREGSSQNYESTTMVAVVHGTQDPPIVTSAVRRLTPRECERLQGFPDDYTRIPWRGKPAEQCPDGPRYKALGNSWAVPLFAWLGARIARLMPPTAANDNNQTQVIRDAA